MNCEKCQNLISDFLDGALSHEDHRTLNSHLEECLECADVRNDLQSIVGFCRSNRGDYAAPPNERALWLRIRNVVEAGASSAAVATAAGQEKPRQRSWNNWLGRSWELSLPQLVASAAAIVLVVSLSTAVGLRRWQGGAKINSATESSDSRLAAMADVRDRVAKQQQLISYWNQRVEFNKARWSSEMRETFDRSLSSYDQAIKASIDTLAQKPHDEVSEEILNTALNEKLQLLKEFAEL